MSDPPISEEPPVLTEVREAIFKLNGGKALGICGIPAELLKVEGERIAHGLAYWLLSGSPFSFSRTSERGERIGRTVATNVASQCSLYQVRFSLISILNGSVTTYEGTNGQSSLDLLLASPQVLALRVIVERRREFGRGLLEAYIDPKKASRIAMGDPETVEDSDAGY